MRQKILTICSFSRMLLSKMLIFEDSPLTVKMTILVGKLTIVVFTRKPLTVDCKLLPMVNLLVVAM